MIIADENIEQYWIALLRRKGHEVISIRETSPGISDQEVIRIVQIHRGILLTEDKDFGELVFAHGFKELSVVLLRYNQPNYTEIEAAVLHVISKYYQSTVHYFITITASAVRIMLLGYQEYYNSFQVSSHHYLFKSLTSAMSGSGFSLKKENGKNQKILIIPVL